MAKKANRILSALLVLVMVLSMLPATVFATGETENVLEGWNVALGENIGVKFCLNSADYTVTATVSGAEVTPTISDNVVTVNVAAAQMNDPIVLTVKSGEETVHTDEYSVREYAETILSGEYDDYVKQIVREMLNYGAAAQTYFAYNADNLANAGYEMDATAQVPTEVPEFVAEDALAGIDLYGASLVFRSKTAVRFYFTVSGSIADYTFKAGETSYEPVEKDGLYYVEIGDINPQDLDKTVTVNVNDSLSVSYSPLNYIIRKYNGADSSDALKNLMQAMYCYHLEAKYYDSVVPVGALQSSGHGWSEGGIYATMSENDAYYVESDWSIEYTPVNADVIKLVRGGVTTSVGVPGNGALIKFTATDYYLKTSSDTIGGDVLPLQDQDYLIVEGRFTHSATGAVMYISKTYIYNNGGTLEFSTTEPVLPVSYDVGVLQANVNGHGAYGEGIYFSTQEANDAPYAADGAWDFYYDTASVDCLKLVRDGQTISVGLTGRNTICKFSANDYALRLESHTIGDYAPFTTDDMFIVEGAFTHVNSKTTLNIEKTYIYHDGSAWVFSASEPVIEPETESPFTFNKGVFSADIFNNRNNGLSVSVENQQLKLQQPEGASNWLWIKQNMSAGTTVTMDVTLSAEGMNIYGYGAKENGDPITEGTVTDSVPQGWFWGQGGSASGSYTFTIYEDCYGLSLMLGFASSTETAIYIDNVVIVEPAETESPFTFDGGSYSADIFNNRNNGLAVSVENKQLKLQQPEGASNWLWIKQNMPAGTTVTMDVTLSAEGMNIFGYGAKENGDPITEGTVTDSVPQGWFWGQGGSASGSYTFTIYEDCYGLSLMLGFASSTETAIYLDNVVITLPETVEPTVVSGGNMTENADGWDAAGDIFFTLTENAVPVDENAEIEYTAEAGVITLVRGEATYDMAGTVVKYGDTAYYLNLSGSENLPLQDKDYLIVEGSFTNADNGYTLNIAKTYVLVDGENLIYSTTEPEISEPVAETESPFTFDSGVFSADIFNNRNNGLSVSVENKQLKLQQPEGASNWLWIKQNMPAGTTVTMDVTLSAEGMNIFGYGAKENGDPITEGTVTESVPQGWFWGQGGSASGSYTFTIYEDCYGLSLMLGFASSTETTIYIDNVVITVPQVAETESPFTFDNGLFSADIFNNRNNGLSVSVENQQLKLQQPEGASNWLWIKQDMVAGTTVTMDVTFSGEGMSIFGYGAKENGDPITEGTVTESVPQGWFWGQGGSASGSYTFTIYEDCYGLSLMLGFASSTETAIYVDNVVITAPETTVNVYEVGVLAPHSAGVNVDSETGYIKGIYAVGTATEAAYDTDWNVDYGPVSAENIQLIRDGVTYNVGVPGTRTLILFSQTDYYLDVNDGTFTSSLLPVQDGDILVLEGEFSCNQDANSIINITKTYISISDNSAAFSAADPRIINVGTMYAYEAGYSTSSDGNISGIYFMNEPNAVPANADWSVRYAATDASNVKLIRGGTTQNIAVVGANTIVKMSDQAGWLCLENSSIISTYPVVAGDILVVEGAFRNSSNGYTMVIDKTYIVVGSDGVSFTTQYEETDYGTVILPTSVDTLTIGTWAGSYHHFTDERLAELRSAGITKILGVNPAYVGGENNNDVAVLLDRCAKYGISVVIDLRDWDGSTVPAYANHPNLIGFLMFDEPNTADFETLAALKTQFDAVMPADKLFYVNLFPECAADGSLGELTWWDELVGTDLDYDEDYVTAFLNAMDIEVLSWDNYSLLEGSGIRTDYYHNFEVMASKNLPLWYTMLSAGHGTTSTTYATPTAAELRWQMAVAMTYGVQNIDHYVYYSHETDYTCMLQCVDGVYSTTALYDDILAVDNEYLAWDNIFMAYDWVGVGVHNTGSGSSMLTMLENSLTLSSYGIAATSASENLLIGVFENNGNKAYMVTNAGSAGTTTVGDGVNFSMNDTTVTLTLTDADYKCVAVIDNGEISYVAVNADNTVTLNVQAYEGVFVIPVLN